MADRRLCLGVIFRFRAMCGRLYPHGAGYPLETRFEGYGFRVDKTRQVPI
jgi:hypothetical protein